MRSVVVAVAILIGLWAEAAADTAANAKALKPYVGKLVISPDKPPSTQGELPGYLKVNLTSDGAYDLVKGPPWPFHVTAVLAKPLKEVTLVITDKADPKAAPMLSSPFKLANDRKLLLAQSEATIAAGFAASKTYVVKLMNGKKQLAKAELTLRD